MSEEKNYSLLEELEMLDKEEKKSFINFLWQLRQLCRVALLQQE